MNTGQTSIFSQNAQNNNQSGNTNPFLGGNAPKPQNQQTGTNAFSLQNTISFGTGNNNAQSNNQGGLFNQNQNTSSNFSLLNNNASQNTNNNQGGGLFTGINNNAEANTSNTQKTATFAFSQAPNNSQSNPFTALNNQNAAQQQPQNTGLNQGSLFGDKSQNQQSSSNQENKSPFNFGLNANQNNQQNQGAQPSQFSFIPQQSQNNQQSSNNQQPANNQNNQLPANNQIAGNNQNNQQNQPAQNPQNQNNLFSQNLNQPNQNNLFSQNINQPIQNNNQPAANNQNNQPAQNNQPPVNQNNQQNQPAQNQNIPMNKETLMKILTNPLLEEKVPKHVITDEERKQLLEQTSESIIDFFSKELTNQANQLNQIYNDYKDVDFNAVSIDNSYTSVDELRKILEQAIIQNISKIDSLSYSEDHIIDQLLKLEKKQDSFLEAHENRSNGYEPKEKADDLLEAFISISDDLNNIEAKIDHLNKNYFTVSESDLDEIKQKENKDNMYVLSGNNRSNNNGFPFTKDKIEDTIFVGAEELRKMTNDLYKAGNSIYEMENNLTERWKNIENKINNMKNSLNLKNDRNEGIFNSAPNSVNNFNNMYSSFPSNNSNSGNKNNPSGNISLPVINNK